MAQASSERELSLVIYPAAPDLNARRAYCASECMLNIRTGVRGRSCLSSLSTSRPLRPSSETSRMTRSQSCSAARWTASAAVAASPKVAGGPFCSKILFTPSRRTSWSSTSRTLVKVCLRFGLGNGDVNGHGRPLAACALDLDSAPGQMSSLPHSQYPKGVWICDLRVSNTQTVIGDSQLEVSARLPDRDIDARRLGVSQDVRKSLLRDAKHRRHLVSVQRCALDSDFACCVDARPSLELLRLPLQGLTYAQVVQNGWPQFGRNPLNGANVGLR